MQTFLTPDEILQLVTTGVCTLTDDLMLRIEESASESESESEFYEESEWFNDPNNVMSKHHY